jgi:hypothetical protein
MTSEAGAFGQKLTLGNLFGWPAAMVRSPRRFFAGLSKDGGFLTPVVFSLFWIFVSTLVEILASRVRPQPINFGLAVELGWLLMGPLLLLVIGFIVAGVFFVIWHLMGSKENYQTAFRCWAFTTPVAVAGAVLGMVPFLNALAFLYGMYLLVIASQETHKASATKSWAVWGSLTVLLSLLMVLSLVARRTLQQQGFGQPGGGLPTLPQVGQSTGQPDAGSIQQMAERIQKQMEEQQAGASQTGGGPK